MCLLRFQEYFLSSSQALAPYKRSELIYVFVKGILSSSVLIHLMINNKMNKIYMD